MCILIFKPKNSIIMNSKTASIIFGLAFLAVGCLGFVDNPIIGESPDAIFHADMVHNIVHIVSGLLFLLVAMAAPGSAAGFCKIFGIVYLLIGIVGMVQFGTDGMGKLFGFLHVNGADNYLHIGLGLAIFLAGLLKPRTV
jgi:Domain of unknown function (DUF4383)